MLSTMIPAAVYSISGPHDTTYIGKTIDPAKRYKTHLSGRGNSPYLQAAVAKYGAEAFTFAVLEWFDSEDQAYAEEAWYIEYLRAMGAQLYNLNGGGRGTTSPTATTRAKIAAAHRGRKASDATRQKMCAAKGRPATPKQIARNRALADKQRGVKRPPEVIAKMSASATGRKASAETRAKLSAARMGNQHLLGHKPTLETRAKISAANTGRIFSSSHRANLALAWQKKKASWLAP